MSEKMQIKVTTELWKNADGKHLNLVTDICGQIIKKVIALEEQTTIDTLVRLGWKPPDASHDDKFLALEAENERLRGSLALIASKPLGGVLQDYICARQLQNIARDALEVK